jgi:hypothetical protein
MKQNTTRKSHCNICGKRLSEKTVSGAIRWKPGHVDDSGLYCMYCDISRKSSMVRENAHA